MPDDLVIEGFVDNKTCDHCKIMRGLPILDWGGFPPLSNCENLPTEEEPDNIGCRCFAIPSKED